MITSMTVDGPKRAVLINPFSPKLVCPLPAQSYTSLVSFNDKIQIKSEPIPLHKKGRKRSLDHLSYEEKLQRKKLKNREAAQTSRDRKKQRMDELERVVKLLEKSNKELKKEVNTLRVEKEEIQKENDRLKEELRCTRCTLESTSGSAESMVHPLPQGHSSRQNWSTFEEHNWDLSSLSETCFKDDQLNTNEMVVGTSPTLLESSKLEPSTTSGNHQVTEPTEPIGSTIIQDAWEMTVKPENVPHSELQFPIIPKIEIKEENTDMMLEDMISEEIVITSEDLFLNDACDERITTKSICSDADTDDRCSDQGYESIDSPFSDMEMLPELFPELL